MLTLAIKTLIILLIISNMPIILSNTPMLIFLLTAITITSLNQYYNTRKLTFALMGSYTIISLFYPTALIFLPVLFVDIATFLPSKHTFFLPLIFLIINNQHMFFHILTGLIALVCSHMLARLAEFDVINKAIRDINALQKKSLILKNQELLSFQADEINTAKLMERNRIARDIHDTVGHYLSRALLQTGALSAMNQTKAMQPAIHELQKTLTYSMNSIRNGVHDLKNDSIDLQATISEILNQSGFKFSFIYDIFDTVPNIVKNCFLVVLQESITNIRKHSDAKKISVRIIEHPAMYQFLVADNGTREPEFVKCGIGLQNIQERINELDGYCSINYQEGFRIFFTIPKKKESC